AQTQAMADLRPDLASLSRASYARELRGDLPGAVQAMAAAVDAGGSGGGENVAYVQAQLGTLLLTSGDTSGAEAAYASAERSFPGFASARAGRAAVLVPGASLGRRPTRWRAWCATSPWPSTPSPGETTSPPPAVRRRRPTPMPWCGFWSASSRPTGSTWTSSWPCSTPTTAVAPAPWPGPAGASGPAPAPSATTCWRGPSTAPADWTKRRGRATGP